ncbi:MAG TPA: hypothetical protein VNA14_00055 [Mycobacteriales bacterium]|nr:hypothetical protein [Mycobacteriales bacterium]
MRRSSAMASILMASTVLTLPAVAAPPARCSYPGVKGPAGYSEAHRAQAAKAPTVELTDKHDAARPLKITYRHAPGATVFHQADVNVELVFHTVRINSRAAQANLWLRAEFSEVATDVDLYAYSHAGPQVAYSESSNNEVEDAVYDRVFYEGETGGPGFENVNGAPVRRCLPYTVVTQNSGVITETPVRLLLWLGPPGKGGH